MCFAVDLGIQGVGIGNRLMAVILHKARQMGADRIYLETNRRCAAAIHLNEKHGFKTLYGEKGKDERYDVQMELRMG